jgi:hypothetical protein
MNRTFKIYCGGMAEVVVLKDKGETKQVRDIDTGSIYTAPASRVIMLTPGQCAESISVRCIDEARLRRLGAAVE